MPAEPFGGVRVRAGTPQQEGLVPCADSFDTVLEGRATYQTELVRGDAVECVRVLLIHRHR